jgi:hypothetical protein
MIYIGTAYIHPKYYNACTILDLQVLSKDMDVNEHERLSSITLGHKFK